MFASDRLTAASLRLEVGSNRSYLIAGAIMVVAAIIRVELPMFDWMPYLTFFPAVVVITLVCGGAAGLVSMLLSLGIAWLLLMPAALSFDNLYRSVIFTIGCCSVIFVAATVRHATALVRRLNATLRQSETKFRGLLESAPDAMVIVDGAGRIALVNAAAERLFGYPRTRLLGETPDMLMPATAGGELVGKRQDGTLFPIEVSHSPLQTEDGSMISSAIRDVTARKQIEADLLRASRAKTDFLSGMSHELRTPLNAVVGFAELLQMGSGGDLTAKQEEYVGHILEGGQHLLVLVTQLLDLAGIEAGKLNLSIMPVDVAAVLRYVHGLMSPLAQQAEIEFVIEIPANIADARADELRLRQVLINFLSNAIKYNHAGGRVILAAEPGDGAVRFTVSDTGSGISPDRTEDLFQPFNRLGAEHSKVSGTGIGLAYSRKIVEAMGGTVGFTSEVGKGSVFWVDLPAEPEPAASIASAPASNAAFLSFGADPALSPA
jgi:protein-histidine pros-kinase